MTKKSKDELQVRNREIQDRLSELNETVVKENIRLVALSALMTTTVPAMEETIKLLRKEVPSCKVVVGGAVLTQEYADMIKADFYGKDAMDCVKYCEKYFELSAVNPFYG